MSFLDEYRDKFEEEGGPSFYYEKYEVYSVRNTRLYKTISEELEIIQNIPSKIDSDENLLILFTDDEISITTTKYNNIATIRFERENIYSILEHRKLLGSVWEASVRVWHGGTLPNYREYDRNNKIPFTFEVLASILISRGF